MPLILVWVLAVALVPYYAWALRQMWEWFVVPLGFEPLTFKASVCIGTFKAYFLSRTDFIKNEYLENWAVRIVTMLVSPLIYLGISWVIQRIWL